MYGTPVSTDPIGYIEHRQFRVSQVSEMRFLRALEVFWPLVEIGADEPVNRTVRIEEDQRESTPRTVPIPGKPNKVCKS